MATTALPTNENLLGIRTSSARSMEASRLGSTGDRDSCRLPAGSRFSDGNDSGHLTGLEKDESADGSGDAVA